MDNEALNVDKNKRIMRQDIAAKWRCATLSFLESLRRAKRAGCGTGLLLSGAASHRAY